MSKNLNTQRIGIFYFGGGSKRFHSQKEFAKWASTRSELTLVGNAVPFFIHDDPHTLEDLFLLVSTIEGQWDTLSGLIIYISSSDMIGMANIITYLLGTVDKPVVFYNPEEAGQEYDPAVGMTLLNAVHLAKSDVASCVYLQGSYIYPIIHSVFNPKTSRVECPQELQYGYIDFGTRLKTHARTKYNQLPEHLEHHSLPFTRVPSIQQHCNMANHQGMFFWQQDSHVDARIVCESQVDDDAEGTVPTLILGDVIRVRNGNEEKAFPSLTAFAAIGKFIRSVSLLYAVEEEEEEIFESDQMNQTEDREDEPTNDDRDQNNSVVEETKEATVVSIMEDSFVNDEHEVVEIEHEEGEV